MEKKDGIVYLDLGEGQVERKTAGWTDSQIHNATQESLEAQLTGARNVIDKLRETIRKEEDRAHDLERIIRRKRELREEGYKG